MIREPEPESAGETPPKPACTADFHTGRPDLRQFPRYLWQQLLNKASEEITTEQYGYTGAQGIPELRKEIAGWLFRSRGITVDPADIFITQGATHGLHLIAELIGGGGREILMEDPCHTGMLRTFLNEGCRIVPVPADERGIRIALREHGNACAVYVTPSHQFPLGGILPAARRASLIRFARESDAYLIEDDYDSEFRYCGEPVAPLYSMDPRRVIYVGTFSKSVYPALRIGYVILPRELQKQWIRLRTYTDVQNPILEQAALAMFLRTRKLDRHIQRMRRLYGERRTVLLGSLTENFRREWHVFGDNAGLHLTVEFPGLSFDDGFRKSALNKGIDITPVEYHCIEKGRHQDKLLLGYGHLDPEEIRSGILLLHNHMEEYFG
jgi:GntR family transcriptional regulator/MocR family aminotransferase